MEYLIHLAILFSIYAILAIGLNLIVGYTGLLSITHAAFYGIGAYAVAIMLTAYDMNFFAALAIAVVITGIVAVLIGLVMSRFKDDYYALASFGFNIIVYSVMLNWQGLTRGPLGIPGISRPALGSLSFSDNFSFLILSVILLLCVYLVAHLVTRSSFGRVLKAIREDEQAIQVFGYKTQYYKLVVFVLGACMAAVAGGLFASYITFIDPSTFTLNESIFILSIIILGGLASVRGSIIGALFLILLPELLRFVGFPDSVAAQMRQVVYGLLLIFLMLYRPQGLVGEYKF